MKEIPSKHKLVGKVISCHSCLRSYVIEAGDTVILGFRGKRVSMGRHVVMPCGHNYYISDVMMFDPPRI